MTDEVARLRAQARNGVWEFEAGPGVARREISDFSQVLLRAGARGCATLWASRDRCGPWVNDCRPKLHGQEYRCFATGEASSPSAARAARPGLLSVYVRQALGRAAVGCVVLAALPPTVLEAVAHKSWAETARRTNCFLFGLALDWSGAGRLI